MSTVSAYRRFYAEELRAVSGLRSDALVEAFATVPREAFLGPGPWHALSLSQGMGVPQYRMTADAQPERVYHNIALAIDTGRQLNNGHPASVALWIDALDLRPGERVLHIGAGTGYYSAIIAEVVGPSGGVLALEVDSALAQRANDNLRIYPNVEVICADASDLRDSFDAIFVNAGATHPRKEWLDALAGSGRLVLPLTTSVPGMSHGAGFVVKIARIDGSYPVSVISPVAIFDCAGARDPALQTKLGAIIRQAGFNRIRCLRRDQHPEEKSCVLHSGYFCLSENGPEAA